MKTFKGVFANHYVGESMGQYGGNGYSFKTNLDVGADDEVVVECAAGLAVVKVLYLDDVPSPKATCWAFAKVDREALQELKDADAKRALITRKLDAKLKARKETGQYAELVKRYFEAVKLLQELQGLS
jgi:hypothetical protein